MIRNDGALFDYSGSGKGPKRINPSSVTELMDHKEDLKAETDIGPHLKKIVELFKERRR
jgi:hypothetical protein